jgi:hypothetical protein
VNVAVATRMTVDEIALALAIYCKIHGTAPRDAGRHLDPTPRAHFDEATVWADSNAKVIKLVASDPEAVGARSYALAPARNWFSRLVGLGKPKGVTAPDDDELASVMKEIVASKTSTTKKRRKDHDEIAALVEESLESV